MDEGDFRGVDHMDDQRLRPERFHEPARVKNGQQGQESRSIIRFQRSPSHQETFKLEANTILLCEVIFILLSHRVPFSL